MTNDGPKHGLQIKRGADRLTNLAQRFEFAYRSVSSLVRSSNS